MPSIYVKFARFWRFFTLLSILLILVSSLLFRLHMLHGDLEGFWAVTVRANWRIVFRFEGTDAVDVNYEDYH